MEELHIQKSSDLPNDNLKFRFELHIQYEIAGVDIPESSDAGT